MQLVKQCRPDISEEELKEKISAMKLGGNAGEQKEAGNTEEKKVQGPTRTITSLRSHLVNGVTICLERRSVSGQHIPPE